MEFFLGFLLEFSLELGGGGPCPRGSKGPAGPMLTVDPDIDLSPPTKGDRPPLSTVAACGTINWSAS